MRKDRGSVAQVHMGNDSVPPKLSPSGQIEDDSSLDSPRIMEHIDRPLIAAGVSFLLVAAAWAYTANASRVRTDEPPVLPGTVPILGHALAFGKNSSQLFINARLVIY